MIHLTALTSVSVWLSKPLFRGVIALLLALSCQPGRADTIYETQDDFLKEVFPNKVAGEEIKPAVLWLDKKAQDDIGKILGHSYPQARLRYWRKNDTSVWILDEVGKEYPITAGFVIREEKIIRAQVLIYRETRGMEIHLPSFLSQFKDNKLEGDKLMNKVDGIAGATMSVNAMVKMAQVSLILNKQASLMLNNKAQP